MMIDADKVTKTCIHNFNVIKVSINVFELSCTYIYICVNFLMYKGKVTKCKLRDTTDFK